MDTFDPKPKLIQAAGKTLGGGGLSLASPSPERGEGRK